MEIQRRQLPLTIPALNTGSAVLDRIFAARGIEQAEMLDKRLQALIPFDALMGINPASARLEVAIRAQQRILVVGDFDADGATSSALAVSALRAMGALHVDFLVPNRFEFGYGLTPPIVDVAKRWQPDLIITVDNGISSIEGVDHANALGIDVVITDHHLPPDTLPNACAIVNPNQKGDSFNSKSIAGVGVIFYVMLALRRALSNSGWFLEAGIAEPNMSSFLDLVALGTVADVVALDQNNRILVNQGLARIRQGLCRPGIRALIDIAGRRAPLLKESDLGFSLAPRLNAAGRLDDMSLGINCLLCDNDEMASQYAKQLDQLNTERRKIELEMKEQAMLEVEKLTLPVINTSETTLPAALCLFDPTWHQGVIGILAGRLKEKYHRPVIALAKVSDSEMKGSLRSVPGLNIRDVLTEVDREHPGLIEKFGGHAMAAGLTLKLDAFIPFREAFIHQVGLNIDPSIRQGEILSDGPLDMHDFNLDFAKLLQGAGPWGQQFPEPLFDNYFEVLDQRLVGQFHLKLTLAHQDGGECVDAIAFQVDLKAWPNHRARTIHAAYRLDTNTYNDRTKLQLVIVAMKVVS
jgi:single-stranded-DNA-specific exonuclease